jgi:hypothetical protein
LAHAGFKPSTGHPRQCDADARWGL